jgi:uncharacterized protein with GYD domain
MPMYVSLIQFTDKGVQAIKATTQRAAAWSASVQKLGVSVKQSFWTMGDYDGVIVFEAPDDETATAALLSVDALDNIRTKTLRAFTAPEMDKILAKIP